MDASKGFSLLQKRRHSPHLHMAKAYWQTHVQPHHLALDMTCGNGHDTQFLAELLPEGQVFSVDIQEIALQKAKDLIGPNERVKFLHQSHSSPISELPSPPHLIIYNLGYLPGGDKSITTLVSSTLESLRLAADLLAVGGALSITCYPGHEAGLEEEREVMNWAEKLEPSRWQVCHHRWLNRSRAPSFFWILKLA